MSQVKIVFLWTVLSAFSCGEVQEKIGFENPEPLDAGLKNLPFASSCSCFNLYDNCCAEGLFCSKGICIKKRALGESCQDDKQCADALAFCAGPLNEPATCRVSSDTLDAQRCQTSSECSSADNIRRTCVDSYCKRMTGENCNNGNQCASVKCFSENNPVPLGPPINYCL